MTAQTNSELLSAAASLVVEHRSASVALLQRSFKLGFHQAHLLMAQLASAGRVEEPNPQGMYHVSLGQLTPVEFSHDRKDIHVRTIRDLAFYLARTHPRENTQCMRMLASPSFPYDRNGLKTLTGSVLAQCPQDPVATLAKAIAALPYAARAFPPAEIAADLEEACSRLPEIESGELASGELRQQGLVHAMLYLERRLMERGDPESRAVDWHVHYSILPQGQAHGIDPANAHPEHVVPCAFLQRKATNLIAHGIPLDEVARWIEPYLRVVWIDRADAKRLDGPLRVRHVMPQGWRFGSDCMYARLHLLNIRFVPPVEGPVCACLREDGIAATG